MSAPTDHAPGASPSAALRLMLLLTMAFWGGNVAIVKLLNAALHPMLVSMCRLLIGAVVLAIGLALQRPGWPRLSARQAAALALCALLMVYLNQLCFAYGVQQTSAANAAVILSLNPLVATLLAALLLGDRLTRAHGVGLALGFAGVMAVVLHRPGMAFGAPRPGDVLMVGTVLTYAGGSILVRRLAGGVASAWVSLLVTAGGALLLVLHALLFGLRITPQVAATLAPDWWALLALSGALSTGLGALVWNRALAQQGVARTVLYAYWVPIFGVAVAVALLGEPLTVWHFIGLAAVMAGTWVGTRTSG